MTFDELSRARTDAAFAAYDYSVLEGGPTDGYSMTVDATSETLTFDDIALLRGSLEIKPSDLDAVEVRALDRALEELMALRKADEWATANADILRPIRNCEGSKTIVYEFNPRCDVPATVKAWGTSAHLMRMAIRDLQESGCDGMAEEALIKKGADLQTLDSLVEIGVFVRVTIPEESEHDDPPPFLQAVVGGLA